jgi:hypothetical protein
MAPHAARSSSSSSSSGSGSGSGSSSGSRRRRKQNLSHTAKTKDRTKGKKRKRKPVPEEMDTESESGSESASIDEEEEEEEEEEGEREEEEEGEDVEWQTEGHAWLGKDVIRVYTNNDKEKKERKAIITKWVPAGDDKVEDYAMWHIRHDDGDEEDLEEKEVLEEVWMRRTVWYSDEKGVRIIWRDTARAS